jgi:hypothetical protein
MRNMVFGVWIALVAITGMAVGFNGWNDALSYEENVNAIFGAKEMNVPFDPINDTVNWTNGSKPIRAIDGTPFGGVSEQDQIDAKNNAFLGRKDPYVQPVMSNKPVRKIDASWGGMTEQELIDAKTAKFLE